MLQSVQLLIFSSLSLLRHASRPYFVQTWETRYVLLLWLSIISMIPFDLTRMDGALVGVDGVSVDGDISQQRTIDRIVDIAKMYLHVTDKSRDAAAMLLAK